jgi:succinoglycan biosynthesis transport protein ExoP
MKFQTSIWDLIRRWWWLVLIGVVIASGVSYYATSQQPLIYMAKATVGVGTSIQATNPDPQTLALSRSLTYAYAVFARRRPVTEAVIETLGLPFEPEELSERLEVGVISDAQLLEIFAYDTNPNQAAAIAEEVARQLVEEQDPTAGSVDLQMWEAERVAAQERVQVLRDEIDQLRNEILDMTSASEIAEAQNRLTQLEQVLTDNQAIAVQYTQLAIRSPANTVWWVEHAVPYWDPVAPNKTMNVLLSAAAGFLLTAGGVVLMEFFDDTLHWRDMSIEEVEGLPVVGVLAPPSRRDPVTTRYRPRSPAAEAVRQLRARIALTRSPHSPQVVLITSPRPRDGKTITVANLGVASALGGMRTLVIDADLRSPNLNELFDTPNVLGLADLLDARPDEREALLPRAVRETETPDLFLLTAGRGRRDPAVLLGSPEMADLLATLKALYGYIVIDSPPVMASPDATIMAALAEGTVMVLRIGKSTRRLARMSKERLLAPGGASLLGVAMTGVPAVAETPHRGHGYHYAAEASDQHTVGWGRAYQRLPFLRRLPLGVRAWEMGDGTVLLPIPVVAGRLGVRRSLARNWCKTRRLKAVRKLFRWWVPEKELVAFMQRELGKAEPAPEEPPPGGTAPGHEPEHEEDVAVPVG